MLNKDLFHQIAAKKSITNANLTGNGTTTTGATVDRRGYHGATVIIEVGAPADTLSGSLKTTFKLQDSDDDSSYADVVAANLMTESGVGAGADGVIAVLDNSSSAQNGSRCYTAGYIGGKRYLKVLAVRTGNHASGTPTAASVLLGPPLEAPAGANA